MTLNINSGKITRAVKTVIYGTEGIGKSTLASGFPNPLFLDIEGGTAQMDVRRIEAPKNWAELVSTVKEVAANPGICGTLILDTADRAESLLTEYICRKYNQLSIESFGYGKGYTYLGEEWQRLMDAFNSCIDAGLNVTVIAHAKQRKVEQPDQIGAYDHWEMKLSRQVAPLLKEWADLLLFCNYKLSVVTTDSNSRKVQGGKRVMYTSHNPVWDAKNRHGLPEELELSFNGIAKIFGNGDAVRGDSSPQGNRPRKESPQTAQERLAEMMAEAGITEYQLREVVAAKGHYPIETPLSDYSDKIVNGFCIRHFDKIVKQIRGDEA